MTSPTRITNQQTRVRSTSFERIRSNSYGSNYGNKILSLKHLRDFIAEVFEGKFKHDQKC